MTIRIVLADDHAVFAEGLRVLLDQEPDMQVVGHATGGAEAVELVAERRPHVVVMDMTMPGVNGIDATRRILAAEPTTRVLCLSMHDETRFVGAVLDAGASGYLLKECMADELIGAIRAIMKGQTYLSPSVTGPIVQEYRARPTGEEESAFAVLTVREREVLQLLAEGHSAKEIAHRLQVSVKTVGTHREHVMQKLAIHSVAGLTKYAIREGLTGTGRDSSG